jgi:23S rRNA (adenine2503-C2)-methyltransferase
MDNKNDKATVCVSSQVGCPIKCAFCATGQLKFVRNLSVAEILIQVYYFAKNHPISNLVFMGMGEPFLNYENVLAAAKILNEELGLNIASRKIVFSTVGIVPGILKLKEESKQFRLAWSLISAFDDTRKKLINYRGLSTIKEVVQAIQQYQKKTKRRITIEYVLLKGINDSYKDMHALADICRQIDAHVNLIPFNLSKGICFTGGKVEAAYKILKQLKINVTTRTSLGGEILAACGQLAGQ